MADIHRELCRILGSSQVKTNELMSRHTTFRVGGPATLFVSPEDDQGLAETVKLCVREEIPYYILGNGSNILVSDRGYDGVIIEIGEPWKYVKIEGETVTAGAGTSLGRLAREVMEASLSGFEFAAGIPGTLGGAVVMNAGAYGSEMKAVLIEAKVLSKEGELKSLTLEELQLGYRTSCIPGCCYIVLEAKLGLEKGSRDLIFSRMEDLSGQRRAKQPLEYPSAGSTFKRPAGYFAGKLIDDAGLRGFCFGGAQISEKHCGFAINKDHATAADILGLCRAVQQKVRENSGVELEMEVKTLGIF